MKASDILTAGAGHLKDREATYDQPGGERSIPNVVTAFNALTGHNLTAEQGWLLLLLLKAGRSQQGGYRADNYEDGAAYFALMGEQAAGDRGEVCKPVSVSHIPAGFTLYNDGDEIPGPGAIVDTVDKWGCFQVARQMGFFPWADVIGYRVVGEIGDIEAKSEEAEQPQPLSGIPEAATHWNTYSGRFVAEDTDGGYSEWYRGAWFSVKKEAFTENYLQGLRPIDRNAYDGHD